MLETRIGKLKLKNPLIMASGTYGYGEEYRRFYDPSIVGAISSKGLTYAGKAGNSGIRIWETPSGILNSIGLENPDIEHFCQEEYQEMRSLDTGIIVNLGGNSRDDYLRGAERLNDLDIDLIELNISCPNVKEGGLLFGLKCDSAASITREVVDLSRHPVMVKLSPNGDPVADLAQGVQEAGAAAVSLINTVQGMAVDIAHRKPVFDNVYAGLSGPCIFPLALRMVHQVAKAVDIPVVGLGGIASAEDVLAMLMVGASAVQIGTMNFHDPFLVPKILQDLEDYCQENHLENISEIIACIK